MSRINPRLQGDGLFVADWLLARSEISLGAKIVYARLVRFYNRKNGYAWPTLEELAKAVGLSSREVQRCLAELRECGLIESERPGLGKSNRYFFLDHEWMHEDASDQSDLDEPSVQTGRTDHTVTAEPSDHIKESEEQYLRTVDLKVNTTGPPPEFEEFHRILSEISQETGVKYTQSKDFWPNVQRLQARGIDINAVAHRLADEIREKPKKYKTVHLTIIDWLERRLVWGQSEGNNGRNGTYTPDIQRLRGGQGVHTRRLEAYAERVRAEREREVVDS